MEVPEFINTDSGSTVLIVFLVMHKVSAAMSVAPTIITTCTNFLMKSEF